MAKVKFTKNELKKQKDALKMYNRYLPTLILKKQQLQIEIQKVEEQHDQVRRKKEDVEKELRTWAAVFGEEAVSKDVAGLLVIEERKIGAGNIAGVNIPVFEGAVFAPFKYDLWTLPPWVDASLKTLQDIVLFELEMQILSEQSRLLSEELKITTQRVNLFEKVKIPETEANIKKISIYLGDQRTAAVVQGKISKRNLQRAVS